VIFGSELVQWLWPTLIQQELDKLRDHLNCHATYFDPSKKIPSGVLPDVTVSLCTEYRGENCLQSVDTTVVQNLMEELRGEDLIHFVSIEYADCAQGIFNNLGISKLTFKNVWEVFSTMLPHLSN
jgi:hypothetical protein